MIDYHSAVLQLALQSGPPALIAVVAIAVLVVAWLLWRSSRRPSLPRPQVASNAQAEIDLRPEFPSPNRADLLGSRCSLMFPQPSFACLRWQQEHEEVAVLQAIHEALCRTRADDPLLTIGLGREARARAGSRGHEDPAYTMNGPRTSDHAWTCVPALVFPRCSLALAPGPARSDAHFLSSGMQLGRAGRAPQAVAPIV
jgi:hypothetical protein